MTGPRAWSIFDVVVDYHKTGLWPRIGVRLTCDTLGGITINDTVEYASPRNSKRLYIAGSAPVVNATYASVLLIHCFYYFFFFLLSSIA